MVSSNLINIEDMPEFVETILKVILAILALFGGKEVFKIVFNYQKKDKRTYISGASGETVGRDKVVVNNYHFAQVGDPDSLLQGGSAVPPQTNTVDLISDTLKVLVGADNTFAVQSDGIAEIISFFQKVFDANTNGRTSQSLMKGAFFALLSEGTNLEWEEHCAGSLREFFHQWKGSAGAISAAFNKIKEEGATTFPTMSNNDELYKRQHMYYEYFSAKCHHEHDNAVRTLRLLLNDNDIKNDTHDIFKKIVAKFLTELDSFIGLTKV